MNESKIHRSMTALTLLGNFLVHLKKLLTAGLEERSKQEPEQGFGKPLDKKINDSLQKKVLFLVIILILMLTFINSVQETQREEISSKFGKETKIDRATVFGFVMAISMTYVFMPIDFSLCI